MISFSGDESDQLIDYVEKSFDNQLYYVNRAYRQIDKLNASILKNKEDHISESEHDPRIREMNLSVVRSSVRVQTYE